MRQHHLDQSRQIGRFALGAGFIMDTHSDLDLPILQFIVLCLSPSGHVDMCERRADGYRILRNKVCYARDVLEARPGYKSAFLYFTLV